MRQGVTAVLVAASVVAVMVATAACGGPAATAPSPEAPAAGAFPVTIEHAMGSTTISAAPQRIVALSFEEDVLSQIGITSVGHADNAYTPGTPYPWQVGAVDASGSTALPSDPLNVEAVAALRPDLILATNYFGVPDTYEQLSAIAPTVAYRSGWGEATWQETARVIGRAVGQEADVEREIAEVDTYVSELARQLPGLRGRTFSSVYYHSPGTFAVDTNPDGQTARLLGQLGMVLSPQIVAEVEDRTLSMERIGLIDADLVSVGYGDDALEAELNASPLFQAVPAVRDGRTYETDNFGATAVNNPTMLNVRWLLDEWRPLLEQVAG